MSRLGKQQARIKELVEGLDPSSFMGRVDEYRRGGLPAASFSEGRGGGGAPLPLLDCQDRDCERDESAYRKALNDAETGLDRALRIERAWSAVFVPKPEPEAVPCSNTACVPTPEHPEWGFLTERDIDEGRALGKGECARCRAHRSKYAMAYPQKATPAHCPTPGA